MTKIPFNQDEIDLADLIPGFFPGMPPSKLYKTPITPKENYRLLYSSHAPLWIPLSGDSQMLLPRIDPDNIARVLVVEANPLKPEEMTGGPDRHGIEWVYVPVAGGSMVKPGSPLLKDANDWKSVVKFPNLEEWDWDAAAASNASYINPNLFLTATILSGFFERLISLMDFDDAAVALIDEDQKDAVKEFFDALADLYNKMIDKYVQYFHIDAISLHDDWGSQRSPFFSLDTALEMIVPAIRKVTDHCHEIGIFYDQHSCGKNEKLVPAYIAAGVDSWSGQPMNDKEWIYENYGDKLILGIENGLAMDPATFQALATPEEAKEAAKAFLAKYGPDYQKKPVLLSMFGGPAEFIEEVYIGSRKLLGE
jgi:hypothetical protein